MYSPRFTIGGDDDDQPRKQPTHAAPNALLEAGNTLKLTIYKRPEGRIMLSYELQGEFGEEDEDDGLPTIAADDATAKAKELLAGFMGLGAK